MPATSCFQVPSILLYSNQISVYGLKKITGIKSSYNSTSEPFILASTLNSPSYRALTGLCHNTSWSSSCCGAHIVESYFKQSSISDTNWLSSFFIIVDQKLVEFIM